MKNNESGFTLIELLTVMSILSILAALGASTWFTYKSDAAYAVAERLVGDGVLAVEAAINVPDQAYPAVASYSQTLPGPISDPTAATVLPGLMIPRKVKFQASFDPSCTDSSCVMVSLQANHCQGKQYIRWLRFGDGVDLRMENLAGSGCP